LSGEFLENLVDVGHIEIATQTKIFRLPIVAPQEGMDVGKTAFARRGIAQMTHVKFATELTRVLGENLADGIFALGSLAEHILVAGLGVEFHTRDASTFLTSVVLLLHHQIEFVQAVSPRAVLLFVILNGFQQANHRHATFVFQLLHPIRVCFFD